MLFWYRIRHLNPLKMHPERTTIADENMVNDLENADIKFPVSKKKYSRIEKKNNICINVFRFEDGLVYPVHISVEKSEYCMNLLLITDKNKSHYVYIKDFDRFMCNKTTNKNKKHFCKYCLKYLSSEKALQEHKKICLKIHGGQSIKLNSGSIKFKNHFKQLAVPFKIYADLDLF